MPATASLHLPELEFCSLQHRMKPNATTTARERRLPGRPPQRWKYGRRASQMAPGRCSGFAGAGGFIRPLFSGLGCSVMAWQAPAQQLYWAFLNFLDIRNCPRMLTRPHEVLIYAVLSVDGRLSEHRRHGPAFFKSEQATWAHNLDL